MNCLDKSIRMVKDYQEDNWNQSSFFKTYNQTLCGVESIDSEWTGYLKLKKGHTLCVSLKAGFEIVVLKGESEFMGSDFCQLLSQGDYFHHRSSIYLKARQDSFFFLNINHLKVEDVSTVHESSVKGQWLAGHGGLQVMPLNSYLGEHTAFVKWPANEVFQPHTHFGGEEIVVLSGTFMDDHGTYPEWGWLRNPHLSKHFPQVVEETIILVKTGHLIVDD